MSRSFKKALIWVSRARDALHRRRERHAVKQALHIDPESDIPLRDSKELGHDDWGTCLDMEFDPSWDDDGRYSRK